MIKTLFNQFGRPGPTWFSSSTPSNSNHQFVVVFRAANFSLCYSGILSIVFSYVNSTLVLQRFQAFTNDQFLMDVLRGITISIFRIYIMDVICQEIGLGSQLRLDLDWIHDQYLIHSRTSVQSLIGIYDMTVSGAVVILYHLLVLLWLLFRFGAAEKCSLIDINNWINITRNNISWC